VFGEKAMKSFIIVLKNHEKSEQLGQTAIESAQQYHWDLEMFNAIDGRNNSLENYNLKPTTLKKKPNRLFQKPGVVGCFLSHYILWKHCLTINQPIGIFEQDVVFQKENNNIVNFTEVLRLDKPDKIGKDHGTGIWWQGSHSYFLKPAGAKKLIDWSHKFGASPADHMLGTNIVDIQFNLDNLVVLSEEANTISLTRPDTF